jgi:membrane fusion protein (multidrug efflux system)
MATEPVKSSEPDRPQPPPANSLPPSAHSSAAAPHPAVPAPQPSSRRWWFLGIAVLVVAAAIFYGIPLVHEALTTVSTDDAYVNGHVTFVAPRVVGQVTQVLVDDNNRVRTGDLLVQLDDKPYRVIVELKEAALAGAKADLLAAHTKVRGYAGQVRGARWKLQHAIEDVHNQVAALRAKVATLATKQAALARAEADFRRGQELLASKAISREDFDQRQEAYQVAKAQVQAALEDVYESRVALGLPSVPPNNAPLETVPPDIDQTASSVREALFPLFQSAAQLGIVPSSYELTPDQTVAEFKQRDPKGDIDKIYTHLLKEAPPVKQAEASLAQAQADLDQAKLNLSYCNVYAEIDGVVTRRNVNPGNNVQVGQALMALRSIKVWVDANFKETQLGELRRV